MFSKLINLGIEAHHDLADVKRIKLLNQIVLLFSAFIFFKILLEIFSNDLKGTIIATTIVSSFLVTLILHYFKKTTIARIYFTVILALAVMSVNIMFGRGFGSEFGIFPITIVIIIFFDTPRARLFWMFFFLFLYGISTVFLYYNEPLMIKNLSTPTFYFMFFACTAAVFLAASFFMEENRKYELDAKKLLTTLETKNQGLQNANKELERFAYVASHDLKTPLRNVNSFLNLIQRKIRKGQTEEISEYLEFAILNAKRMYTLIEDILEFSRFSNGEFAFKNEALNDIIDLTIDNIRDTIHSKNAVIHYTNLPTIYCNKTQMISLFQNLIENGLKYNQSNVPSINITCEDNVKGYEILISDNGIGIEKRYQDRIFEMFYRLHNQGEYEGSGIGLSSCKKIVTYHGGEIKVKSEIGKGSTFVLSLPKISQDESLKTSN